MTVQKERLNKLGLTLEDVDDVISGEGDVTYEEISEYTDSFLKEVKHTKEFCEGKVPNTEHFAIYNEAGEEIGVTTYKAYIHESYEDVVAREKATGISTITRRLYEDNDPQTFLLDEDIDGSVYIVESVDEYITEDIGDDPSDKEKSVDEF